MVKLPDNNSEKQREEIRKDVQFIHGRRIEGKKCQRYKYELKMARMNKNHILYRAALQDNFELVRNHPKKLTVDDCNIKDDDGNTPLYYAIYRNNPTFVKYLLSHGADPNLICDR